MGNEVPKPCTHAAFSWGDVVSANEPISGTMTEIINPTQACDTPTCRRFFVRFCRRRMPDILAGAPRSNARLIVQAARFSRITRSVRPGAL